MLLDYSSIHVFILAVHTCLMCLHSYPSHWLISLFTRLPVLVFLTFSSHCPLIPHFLVPLSSYSSLYRPINLLFLTFSSHCPHFLVSLSSYSSLSRPIVLLFQTCSSNYPRILNLLLPLSYYFFYSYSTLAHSIVLFILPCSSYCPPNSSLLIPLSSYTSLTHPIVLSFFFSFSSQCPFRPHLLILSVTFILT